MRVNFPGSGLGSYSLQPFRTALDPEFQAPQDPGQLKIAQFATAVPAKFDLNFSTAPGPKAAEEYEVRVKTMGLPDDWPWIAQFAYHGFVDVKLGSESQWKRVEIWDMKPREFSITSEEAHATERHGERIYDLQSVSGPAAKQIAFDVMRVSKEYQQLDPSYIALPGPNSNTFIDYIGREVEGLDFAQPHNAVGETYAFPLRAGITASGDGVEFQTPIFGIRLGLTHGLEIQIFGLTFGISLFPPAIKLPFLPRLGFGSLP